MKKNVNLRITSTQYSENLKPSGEAFLRELEKEDSLEILTEGTMYLKNNARYISYEESEEGGLEDSHTLVKLEDGSIRIRRYGRDDDDDGMDMTLEPGILNITRYQIPKMTVRRHRRQRWYRCRCVLNAENFKRIMVKSNAVR